MWENFSSKESVSFSIHKKNLFKYWLIYESRIYFLFFWEYLFKYKKFKLVSDEQKEEIDQIILILEDYLQEKENKKPLE